MKTAKPLRILFAALVCAAAVSCSRRQDTVSVRIVATSDVHGCIFDIDAVNGGHREGSLAKVSTFLKAERKAGNNVIYVDCGDVLQGSIEMYRDITAEFYKPCLASEAYNLLDCKAAAMGNHDLMVGTESYCDYFTALGCPVLWGNLGFTRPGDYMPPYRIVETDGIRIAFLGLTTPNVEYTIPSDNMGELEVCTMEDAARKWIPVLKEQEKADVIVGLLHAGSELPKGDTVSSDDVFLPGALVGQVPGFDLIIYGHDHRPGIMRMADADGDSLWLANPGPYAMAAVVADLRFDFTDSESPKPEISVRLEDLTGLKPDRKFLKRLSDRWDDVCAYADSTLGVLDEPIDASGLLWRTTSAMDYLHSFQMGFQGAEVSIISCVQDTSVIAAGPLTIRDIFHIYPYDNSMVSLMLKGSEICSILECSADSYFLDGGRDSGLLKLKSENGCRSLTEPAERYLTAAGIRYRIDVTRPFGERVSVESMSDGKPFDKDRYYRTTITSFLYGGKESVLPYATGLSGEDLQKRLLVSSGTDLKYYMISQASLCGETQHSISIGRLADWELVPHDVVSAGLAQDTVGLNLFKR